MNGLLKPDGAIFSLSWDSGVCPDGLFRFSWTRRRAECPVPLFRGNGNSVTIEQSAQWNATIYSISREGCTIQWIARNSEIGVIKHWSRCAAPLSEQLALLEKLCAEFFSKDRNAPAFRTLSWGRLDPETQNGAHELSFRLALAAYRSPAWDSKRGSQKAGI